MRKLVVLLMVISTHFVASVALIAQNFKITKFIFDGVEDTFTLTWNSSTDKTYSINCIKELSSASPIKVATGISSESESTSYGPVTIPVPDAACLFFQVKEEDNSIAPGGFALIPAGSFQMGDHFGEGYYNELPVHNVYVDAFYMGRTEVTYGQWQEVYNWAVNNGYPDLTSGSGKGAHHPVHSVSWYDTIKWCNAASEREGLTAVYRQSDGSIYRSGQITPVIHYGVNGYRLPTEAEWEKAARGSLSGRRFPWGYTISHANANFQANGSTYNYDVSTYTNDTYHPDYDEGNTPYTSPVGSFAPNRYGLYDMAGNVWEKCGDWHSNTYYSNSPYINPTGPASGLHRIQRGGSWYEYSYQNRVSFRSWNYPDHRGFRSGFRLAYSQ